MTSQAIKGVIEWVVRGRDFRMIFSENIAEIQTSEGETLSLSFEEWAEFFRILNRLPNGEPTLSLSTPKNAGKPWTEEEEKRLICCWNENMKINEIARRFERTHGAIKSRLERLGLLT